MPNILYIAYWGALEPLGRSLIVPSVIELSRLGAKITLVTFEKPLDLAEEDHVRYVRQRLSDAGIHWLPKRYHKWPKTPATAYDAAIGVASGLSRTFRESIDVIHGRCFLGGVIGIAVAKLTGKPFVYHNEGFYPDEQVDGGVWTQESASYRLAKYLEDQMYARSDGVIALSKRARDQIRAMSFVDQEKPIVVAPSCVDLEHFSGKSIQRRPSRQDRLLELVYIGSVGGRYDLDRIGRFMSSVNRKERRANLTVYSKADPELVRDLLERGGLKDGWVHKAASYDEMPTILPRYDAGLFSLRQGLSEHGCSPTKVGEYWASGIPVITTPNVSDVDAIIAKNQVGVVIEDDSEAADLSAFDKTVELLKSVGLQDRCREAARENYGLHIACSRQYELYKQLA